MKSVVAAGRRYFERRMQWVARLAAPTQWQPELRVALVLSIAVFELSRAVDGDATDYQHLGAEYFNIARAITDGRGFSDPFGEQTGPTAWMPPLYPALLSILILIFQQKSAIATCILVASGATLVAAGTVIYAIARRTARAIPPIIAVIMACGWVFLFRFWFLVLTTDIWLLTALATAMTWSIYRYCATGEMRFVRWGVIGGIAWATSPALALAWMLLFAFFAFRNPQHRNLWFRAAVLSVVLMTPWMMRNAVVFGKLIPSKSNLMYEAHHANVTDEDGIYDKESMLRHPYKNVAIRFQYASLGEARFIEAHGAQFWATIESNPGGYLKRVANRLYAVALRNPPVLQSQADSKEEQSPTERLLDHVLYPLPLLMLCAALWLAADNRRFILSLALFIAAFLAPYIIVAFYVRYLLPMTPALMVAAFLGADSVVGAFRQLASRGASLVDTGSEGE